jgi:hypothetical protein
MNDFERRQLADSAHDLLDEKAFVEALADLERHWVDELVTDAATTERKLELVAQIKAIRTIVPQLKIYVSRGGKRAHG